MWQMSSILTINVFQHFHYPITLSLKIILFKIHEGLPSSNGVRKWEGSYKRVSGSAGGRALCVEQGESLPEFDELLGADGTLGAKGRIGTV